MGLSINGTIQKEHFLDPSATISPHNFLSLCSQRYPFDPTPSPLSEDVAIYEQALMVDTFGWTVELLSYAFKHLLVVIDACRSSKKFFKFNLNDSARSPASELRVMLSANGLEQVKIYSLEEEAERRRKNNLTSEVKLFWYVWNANNWLSKQHTKAQLKNVGWRKWMMSDDDNQPAGLRWPDRRRLDDWWHRESHALVFLNSALTLPQAEWNKN